ncbi:MAG TPA: Ger(x)C family spore germination protein [Symbiobacteriaceae bacterium]|nr:Ger(x)C family spore germination protein [Symbiobacteriaceae bacterium]
MSGRTGAVGVLLLLLLLLTGCWDLREMNHLALVMAVGVDKAEEPGRLAVTVQIARPAGTGQSPGGGGKQDTAGGQVYIATADGDTIFGAIRNLAQFTSRRIMWAHNNVVVIGESLAREDITPVIDFFTRNQELRMRTWVVVASGTDARSIVATHTGMEDIPANSISALFRYAQLPGETVPTDMAMITADFFGSDRNPVIAGIGLRERAVRSTGDPENPQLIEQVELAGTAILNGTRVVGFVQRETGRGLLWLRRQMKNAVLTIPCPQGREGNMAVEIRSPQVRIQSSVEGRVPVMTFHVETEGWLSEQGCLTPNLRESALKAYAEKALAQKIEREMRMTLQVLQQELKTDAIGYARMVHIQHPGWWLRNQTRWEALFPMVKTQILISTHIPKMGLYIEPVQVRRPGGSDSEQ